MLGEHACAVELRHVSEPLQFLTPERDAIFFHGARERKNADSVACAQGMRFKRLWHVAYLRIRNFQRRVQQARAKLFWNATWCDHDATRAIRRRSYHDRRLMRNRGEIYVAKPA